MRVAAFVKDDFVLFLTAVKIAGELAQASRDPAHLAFAQDCAEMAARLAAFVSFAEQTNGHIAQDLAIVCPQCGFCQEA